MIKHDYLNWMSKETATKWCNDSAIFEEIESAVKSDAIGCTTNPPLSYLSLVAQEEIFKEDVGKIPKGIVGNDRAVELIGVVVRRIAKSFYDMYENDDVQSGYVRSQVQPSLSKDAKAMLDMGKIISSWGKNIMVKIPGTKAGIWVLEELAALGIPTTPTICVSVSQIIAAAMANERGIERAVKNGIKPAPSTAAFVMGRLQDYLAQLNDDRKIGLRTSDLEMAVLAATKRCYSIYIRRGYDQKLMAAAFRCIEHVTQLAGADLVMTIHPKIQDMIIEADRLGKITYEPVIDKPIDEKAVKRVSDALPEFNYAYEPDGLTPDEFDAFGATRMTLEGFDRTGWQKLLIL